MKWFLLGFTLVMAAGVVYVIFFAKPRVHVVRSAPETANQFYNAAIAGDFDAVRELCVPDAADEAVAVAKQVQALRNEKPQTRFEPLDGVERGWVGQVATIGNRFLGLQLRMWGGDWRIVMAMLEPIPQQPPQKPN